MLGFLELSLVTVVMASPFVHSGPMQHRASSVILFALLLMVSPALLAFIVVSTTYLFSVLLGLTGIVG